VYCKACVPVDSDTERTVLIKHTSQWLAAISTKSN